MRESKRNQNYPTFRNQVWWITSKENNTCVISNFADIFVLMIFILLIQKHHSGTNFPLQGSRQYQLSNLLPFHCLISNTLLCKFFSVNYMNLKRGRRRSSTNPSLVPTQILDLSYNTQPKFEFVWISPHVTYINISVPLKYMMH